MKIDSVKFTTAITMPGLGGTTMHAKATGRAAAAQSNLPAYACNLVAALDYLESEGRLTITMCDGKAIEVPRGTIRSMNPLEKIALSDDAESLAMVSFVSAMKGPGIVNTDFLSAAMTGVALAYDPASDLIRVRVNDAETIVPVEQTKYFVYLSVHGPRPIAPTPITPPRTAKPLPAAPSRGAA